MHNRLRRMRGLLRPRPRYATGGIIRPPATRDDDSIPAILNHATCCPVHMNGEHPDSSPRTPQLAKALAAVRALLGVPYVTPPRRWP
jgi:hypothetical protein